MFLGISYSVFLLENVMTCFTTGYSHFITFTAIKKPVFGCCEGGYIYLIFKCTCEQNGRKINVNVLQMLPQWNTDLIDKTCSGIVCNNSRMISKT